MTRTFALILICFAAAAGSYAQQNCTLAGTWTQNSEGLGSSTWTITADGDATESGLGNAKGRASLSGRTLRIDWTIPGYNNSGYYQWTLGDDCRGPGEAVNTVSGARRNTTVAKNPESASIRAELRDGPVEVWVGRPRPSMAAGIFITGFRRNSPDPVVLDCPGATNGYGDHPDASGDPLKTVRIFPCGSNQLTYDWPAEGYNWGILIGAPGEEQGPQPGRPRDICIGTNPVRLKVSQKGAGEAFVTIRPQLLLKAGLVGGGGTYGPTNCTGDDRGRGGGGGGGGLNGTFAIQTANGNFLTAVRGGGIQGPGAINSDATNASGWERFTFVPTSDGKYAIKTSSGNYLTAMRGGGVNGLDVIHTDATGINAWEKFTLEDLGGGNIAIKTVNGNYLTAVGGGGAGSAKPSIHTDARNVGAWERFKLVKLDAVNYDTGAMRTAGLIVQVTDQEDEPVSGAQVMLELLGSGTQLPAVMTDANGDAKFIGVSGIPLDKASGGIRIKVFKAGYNHKWEDIKGSFLKVGSDYRHSTYVTKP